MKEQLHFKAGSADDPGAAAGDGADLRADPLYSRATRPDVMLGARATEESRAMLHAKMGIDKPIYEQFFLFMKNCLRLDFGESTSAASLFRRSWAAPLSGDGLAHGHDGPVHDAAGAAHRLFSGVNKHNAPERP